ncbi:MAG: 4Fe-4S dicluster domain-containing protein [Planctomycetaceae bacterium]|jgi:heterodisulfide reductase subunit C|nr:4Fe-4S dicluster domain-containing protein [Planctomycetaceae bacterium]
MSHTTQNPEIVKIEQTAHTHVCDCYQCGKCSAGCPMADKMEVLPSTLIRLVQCGEILEAAKSLSVWQCVSCLTCSARCPKSVNIAGVIDTLKEISIEKKCVHPKAARILAFQRAFLNTIYRNGRTNELELVAEYKIRGFLNDFNPLLAMKDASLGLPMFLLGKLHLKIGAPVRDKALVKRIFKKCNKPTQ